MNERPANTFERKTFTTSRLSEFATESELTKQVGHPASLWPIVVVKELIDNALDAAENADLAPDIAVTVERDRIIVADQGPGIPAATVKALVDFTAKTSSNAVYCSPSRGQQGNALQSCMAMPFALSGADGSVLIEAQGKAHDIKFTLDPVRQIPVVERTVTPSAVKNGTRTTVRWPLSPRSTIDPDDPEFLRLVVNYTWLNPHLNIKADWLGENYLDWSASNPAWRKWRPNYATSSHWYTPERLTRLVAGEIARAEDKRQPCPSVRDFVRQFAGLSGTQKASAICAKLGVGDRETLADYYKREPSGLKLLAAMRDASRPIKPKALGVLGEDHLKATLVSSDCALDSLVIRKAEPEHEGLPYLLEVAFGYRDDDIGVQVHEGFNFTPAIGGSPFRLREVLNRLQFEAADPVTVFAHVACPRLDFLDRGKARVNLPAPVWNKLLELIESATSKWTKQKKAEIREHNARLRRRDSMVSRNRPISIKKAAYSVLVEAYLKAAGSVGMATLRQVYYAARRLVLEMTKRKKLDSKYFCQTLLVDYMNEHPDECADWDVISDDRGHFREPHSGRVIGLGTVAVREYIETFAAPTIGSISVASAAVTLAGPEGRYSGLMFIEKEGFDAIIEAAAIAEKYDLALASTKGMSVTACRLLVEELCGRQGLPLYVLHDFDVSGFSILKTLTTSNRRYTFERPVKSIDFGLRLADIDQLELRDQAEDCTLRGKKGVIAKRLRINGATEAEIEFLLRGPDKVGQRVELNAMTSDQFVAFVERQLKEHGARKVVPDAELLGRTYVAMRRGKAAERALAAEMKRLNAEPVVIPDDLADRVKAHLVENPTSTWGSAVKAITGEGDDSEESGDGSA
jgi:DNA topoisomerase VI subunit B